MSTSVVTSPGPTRGDSSQNGLWLRSKPWDMCCLTGSSLFVVLPLLLYAQVGRAAIVVNLVVAGLVGGPHMYATFFRTFGDSAFRRGYRVLLLSSLGIPALVIAGAVWHFQLLLTLFFFWASLHVLHQIVYILACYERKQPQPPPPWSRAIDYAVVCSSLYPLASYHLVHDTFYIGTTPLLYPEALKTPIVYYATTSVFALAFLLFLVKTACDIWRGRPHYPKWLLMGTTIGLALLMTSYSGARLEIAFQGLNTWHSFQYLALTWYINTLRQQRGEIRTPFMRWLSQPGVRRFGCFYGVNALLTLGALGLIVAVYQFVGLSFEQSYYSVVLSFLLMHYSHDHVLFTRVGDLVRHAQQGRV